MSFVLGSPISRHIHGFLILVQFVILVSEKWTMNSFVVEFMVYFSKYSIYTYKIFVTTHVGHATLYLSSR